MSDGMGRELAYLSSHATNRYFIPNWGKMHFAVHGHTAAELIVDHADADKEQMGVTTWEKAPNGKIVKADESILYLKATH